MRSCAAASPRNHIKHCTITSRTITTTINTNNNINNNHYTCIVGNHTSSPPPNSRLQSEGITFVSMEIGRHAAMLSRRPGRDCEPTARGMHDSAKPAPTPHTNTSLYRLQTDRQTDTTRLPAMIMSPWARVTRAALRGMEHFPLNGGVMGGEMKRSCPSAVR